MNDEESLSSNRSVSVPRAGIWLSATAAAIGLLGFLALALILWCGAEAAARVGTTWPTLAALGLDIGLLIGFLLTSRTSARRTSESSLIRDGLRVVAHGVGPLLALALVVFVFGAADAWQGGEGNFLSVGSLRLIAIQTVMVAVAAMGMTLIIITGGIDLSSGTMLALSGTVVAYLLKAEYSISVAIVGGVLCGGLCGFINGLAISQLRLRPFIITLGTMTIFLGVGKWIAVDGGTITPPYGSVPQWLEEMVTQSPIPAWLVYPVLPNVAWGVWGAAILALVVAALLHCTVLGRSIFAIGSNEATARLCGIPVARVKIMVYCLAGLLTGIAGLYHFARLSKGDATAGLGLELRIIAAVVIGGGSLSGGRGSVLGTLCGAVTMTVISHGCTALGLGNETEDILLGAIIIAAVYVDQLRNRVVDASNG